MRTPVCRNVGLPFAAVVLLVLAGCGVKPKLPQDRPKTSDIKSWSHNSITRVEKAIRKKDMNLPSTVVVLTDYLDKLRLNVTLGEGSKYGNTEEAVAAIDGVVMRLTHWYNRSKTRREGDTDADREELQTLVDEVKGVLSDIRAGE